MANTDRHWRHRVWCAPYVSGMGLPSLLARVLTRAFRQQFRDFVKKNGSIPSAFLVSCQDTSLFAATWNNTWRNLILEVMLARHGRLRLLRSYPECPYDWPTHYRGVPIIWNAIRSEVA